MKPLFLTKINYLPIGRVVGTVIVCRGIVKIKVTGTHLGELLIEAIRKIKTKVMNRKVDKEELAKG